MCRFREQGDGDRTPLPARHLQFKRQFIHYLDLTGIFPVFQVSKLSLISVIKQYDRGVRGKILNIDH